MTDISVYSFPRSGNFFVTRALYAPFEKNPTKLITGAAIKDLHKEIDNREKSHKYFFKRKNIQIQKTHSIQNINTAAITVIPLRSPTEILRSHTYFSFLHVSELSFDLIDHAKFVYFDQYKYLENLLTLRPCIDNNHDSYISVLTNVRNIKSPVFIVKYRAYTKSPRKITEKILSEAQKPIKLPKTYEEIISKEKFLKVQEDILSKERKKEINHSENNLIGETAVAQITEWAYLKGFRVITNPNLDLQLKDKSNLHRAEEIFNLINSEIPDDGLLLSDDNQKNQFNYAVHRSFAQIYS